MLSSSAVLHVAVFVHWLLVITGLGGSGAAKPWRSRSERLPTAAALPGFSCSPSLLSHVPTSTKKKEGHARDMQGTGSGVGGGDCAQLSAELTGQMALEVQGCDLDGGAPGSLGWRGCRRTPVFDFHGPTDCWKV